MKNEKFKSNMAVLVAVVTVLGAIAACLATAATSDAGDEDFAGLDAAIRAQKAELVNDINAYEHYRAYTSYVRYNQLGNLLYDPNADKETDLANGATQREVWGIASGLLSTFFQGRYLTPDGKYDIQRELDEAWAEDSQSGDINPDPHFTISDERRVRSSFLTGDMILLAFSFWFLTLAQAVENKSRYVWALLGILMAIGGALGILIGRFLI
jgi:hypothetical protein